MWCLGKMWSLQQVVLGGALLDLLAFLSCHLYWKVCKKTGSVCKHRCHATPEGPFTSLALAVSPEDKFGLALCTGSGTKHTLHSFPGRGCHCVFLTPSLPVSLYRVFHWGLESTNLPSPHHCQRLWVLREWCPTGRFAVPPLLLLTGVHQRQFNQAQLLVSVNWEAWASGSDQDLVSSAFVSASIKK